MRKVPLSPIEAQLEKIEAAYGDSKLRKANTLISGLIAQFPEDQFKQAGTHFFSLQFPESDRTLYNKIVAAYEGQSFKDQIGGVQGCRFDVGKARCYSSKKDNAEACIITQGKKGRKGCSLNPEMMPATFAHRRPTKATEKYALDRNFSEIDDILKGSAFNFNNQSGGAKGCRFDVGRARCYSSKKDSAEACVITTGKRGKKGCSLNPDMMPATFAHRGPTNSTRQYPI